MGFFDFIPIVGPVVSAVTGAITNESNNKAIKEENAKQRQFSHDEAILAHNRQLEIMDKQNDWNSYTNQRRLLTDAGYNPNALFNSSSTLSASSGASGGAQASAPSIGMPNPTLLNIGTLSDAALKMAQAKNIDADTEKKESETKGQDLQNSSQEVVNKFLESNIKLDMDKKDAERALTDAQRLAVHTSQMLDFDELHNLRPNQVAKTIAETNASNASALLSKAQAAKTDEERIYISKEFALQTFIANSSVALNYANAYYARSQGDLWQPNFDVNGKTGILFRKSFVDTNKAKLDYYHSSTIFDSIFEEWKNATISTLKAQGLYSENLASSLDGFWGNLYQSFMRNLSFIPGSSTSSAVQPLSVPPAPF